MSSSSYVDEDESKVGAVLAVLQTLVVDIPFRVGLTIGSVRSYGWESSRWAVWLSAGC